jgi:hypothetical protein
MGFVGIVAQSLLRKDIVRYASSVARHYCRQNIPLYARSKYAKHI